MHVLIGNDSEVQAVVKIKITGGHPHFSEVDIPFPSYMVENIWILDDMFVLPHFGIVITLTLLPYLLLLGSTAGK